jgi:hypothetical protein
VAGNSTQAVPYARDEVFYRMDGFLVTFVGAGFVAAVVGGREVEVGLREAVVRHWPADEN